VSSGVVGTGDEDVVDEGGGDVAGGGGLFDGLVPGFEGLLSE